MYALREAIRGMVRTPYMSAVSIVTITVTLTVLCVFALGTLFANGFIYKIRKSEEINVYLEEEMSDEDMLALDAVIASMREVDSTRIMSREDAAREFEKMFGGDLLRAVDENPLPRTIVVVMADGFRTSESMETVADRISGAEGVESVEYGREWMSKMDIVFLFFVFGEAVLVILAAGACLLIISNTISMTILARRDTVEIMRLVGATDAFIRRPFYVEGLVQGTVAGVLSFLVLFGTYRWFVYAVPDLAVYVHMFAYPALFADFGEWSVALIIPVGGVTGLVGSAVAVRRAL